MAHLLILLAIIPLGCFLLTKKAHPKDRWLLFGVSFGTVISPASYGLIQFTSMPVIGKLLGLIGLMANLIHGSLGYFFLQSIGILAEDAPLQGSQLLMIHMVNALIWSSYYGMIGCKIGQKIAGEVSESSHGRTPVRQEVRG
ncbi:MAG: hypothetical protein OEV89_02030 [Desulfobulbaceae bacterium]|nr:hypothetical protein [Desulfobulbaceae bacterium]HIJ89621.1 hypothetical protein [Deltaproteobacteria bacterium]